MRPQASLGMTLALASLVNLSCVCCSGANAESFEVVTQYSESDHWRQALLTAISTWLSANFDLPAATTLPAVEFVTPEKMAALRYRGLTSTGDQEGHIVALYDGLRRTIYLPNGWRGATPVELSILVHEMVHHLQETEKQTFECPQARERLAYAAQERWLGLTGSSLVKEFDIDAFTVLIRSGCLH